MTSKKRVFISYAWESEEFRQSVWELAGWLEAASGNRIEVITDHLFSVRPPKRGWHRWLNKQINNCDLVFCICTPKYKACFDGDSEKAGEGFGAIYETGIILAKLYKLKGKNSKFYPILPDDGKFKDIPEILHTYDNKLRFKSHNQRILDHIMGENPSHAGTGIEKQKINEMALEAIKFENEIVTEISTSMDMSFDVQILIRSYLALSDVEKEEIISGFGYAPAVNDLDERDRFFLSNIHDKALLGQLWAAVNKAEPFENPINPFQ